MTDKETNETVDTNEVKALPNPPNAAMPIVDEAPKLEEKYSDTFIAKLLLCGSDKNEIAVYKEDRSIVAQILDPVRVKSIVNKFGLSSDSHTYVECATDQLGGVHFKDEVELDGFEW